MTTEDRALTQAALRGEPNALECLVTRMDCVPRFVAALNARSATRLGDDELADISQDALLALWQRLPDYEGRARLESFAYRFCYLTFQNAIRARGRDQRKRSHEEPSTTLANHMGSYEDLYGCLDRLTAEDRELVRRRHFESEGFEQIAASFDRPLNTIRSRYYRAFETLRRCLERHSGRDET